MPLMKRYEKLKLMTIGTTSYKARGAGMIRGAVEYWQFAKTIGYVDFNLISGPDTTFDPTGNYVVNGEQHTKDVLDVAGEPVEASKQPYKLVS